MKQPNLTTHRLILRPFILADAADVQRLAGVFEVADTTGNIPHPYEDGMAEAWIAEHAAQFTAGTAIHYAITRKDQGILLGAVSLTPTPRHYRAEIGYWMGVPYWNQGYMTEAAAALVEYGFGVLGLNKITSSHLLRNPASGRVMQKLGMTHEGILHAHFLKDGIFEDMAVYGLLAPPT